MSYVDQREERGVAILLSVETVANWMATKKSRNEKGPFLGSFVGLVVPVEEIFSRIPALHPL